MSLKQTPVSPCKGCEEREVEPNCHTNCIAYRQWHDTYRDYKIKLRNDSERIRDEAHRLHKKIWGGIK